MDDAFDPSAFQGQGPEAVVPMEDPLPAAGSFPPGTVASMVKPMSTPPSLAREKGVESSMAPDGTDTTNAQTASLPIEDEEFHGAGPENVMDHRSTVPRSEEARAIPVLASTSFEV